MTKIWPGQPGLSYPRYIGAERACPPEDCGGIPSFYGALGALADPSYPDHEEVLDYLGHWNPEAIDLHHLKMALGRIVKLRKAGKSKPAKKPAQPRRWVSTQSA